MLICMHYLYDSYTRLVNIRSKIQKEIEILDKREKRELEGKENRSRTDLDIITLKNSINQAFIDMVMVIEESRLFEPGSCEALAGMQVIIPILEDRLEKANSLQEFLGFIDMIVNVLQDFINNNRYAYLDNWSYKRQWTQYWAGSRHVMELSESQGTITKIKQAIRWRKQVTTNVLDFCCNTGKTARDIKVSMPYNISIYGIDSNKSIYKENKDAYKKIIYGYLKGCMISNGVFDVGLCIPKITAEKITAGGIYLKNEREMLIEIQKYIRPGGILIYGIPYYRFYKEICNHIARYYTDVQIIAPKNDTCMVYVIAKKRSEVTIIDKDIYLRLRNLPFTYKDMEADNNLEDITFPGDVLEIQKFRGSELNEEELLETERTSKALANFWKSQEVQKLNESKARPLLPFNIGQLGLVLTSGCLDGIINEGNGYYHAVKGKVVRKTYVSESVDTENRKTQLTTTTNNRVEISVMLPDGTYKCLT